MPFGKVENVNTPWLSALTEPDPAPPSTTIVPAPVATGAMVPVITTGCAVKLMPVTSEPVSVTLWPAGVIAYPDLLAVTV